MHFASSAGNTFLGLGTTAGNMVCSWDSSNPSGDKTVVTGTYRFYKKTLAADPWQDVTAQIGGAGGAPYAFEKDKTYNWELSLAGHIFNEIP